MGKVRVNKFIWTGVKSTQGMKKLSTYKNILKTKVTKLNVKVNII